MSDAIKDAYEAIARIEAECIEEMRRHTAAVKAIAEISAELEKSRAAAPEISEAMLPENGIDIYVNRIGGKLPIHVSRSSLLAALRAAQGGGER